MGRSGPARPIPDLASGLPDRCTAAGGALARARLPGRCLAYARPGRRRPGALRCRTGRSQSGWRVARLLCVESGDALWNAAFLVPPQSLDASDEDRDLVKRTFRFHPYPGIARAVFLAAPHRGSPSAATVLGRLTRALVGRRAPEVHALRR